MSSSMVGGLVEGFRMGFGFAGAPFARVARNDTLGGTLGLTRWR